MQEEQRIILKMLEDGKITAQEAEALLNALSEDSPLEDDEKNDDLWRHLERQGEEFAQKVEAATERFARSLEGRAGGYVGAKLAMLPKFLSKFPFVGFEEAHEFTSVYRGKVAPERDMIPILLSTFNGSIKVQGWSEEGYELTVIQRLRGKDRQILQGRLYEIDWVDGETRESLDLAIPLLEDASVSLHLKIPRQQLYSVRLGTHNGSLKVEDVEAGTVDLETTNGSTVVRNVKATEVKGHTHNGSCKMEGLEADTISHKVGNGSYRLRVTAMDLNCFATNGSISLTVMPSKKVGSYQLRTTNGSISVALPRQYEQGVAVDLSASVGRISTDLGPLEYSRQERRGGGGQIVARAPNFAEQLEKVFIKASSSSGSISVRFDPEA